MMKRLALLLVLATLPVHAAWTICTPPQASPLETFAAKEVRRYLYLRTGELLPIEVANRRGPLRLKTIVVARKDRAVARRVLPDTKARTILARLGPQAFWLKSEGTVTEPVLLVTGGSSVGVLYAAYRFAEHLGVRFFLDGDVVPDQRMPLRLPFLDERRAPLFALRGIQPFHDFPEGPDWWNTDDYEAIIAQLPKLRMNFIGLHTYPEGHPNAEPTVWIGLPSDAEADGRVRFSYPASYQNTLRGNWGYAAERTSDYVFGAAQLFDHDAFGANVMLGFCPQPERPADCNTVFNRTATMLRAAFTLAHRLGVKTCVGTETPLTIPARVRARLQVRGLNPDDPTVVEKVYEGIFRRAAAAYPLDYYWFWTPEGWTWSGTKPAEVQRTLSDLDSALRAYHQVKPPFALATCGWVLGPPQNRTLFDKVLPKSVAVSCINRQVGNTPVDPAFSNIHGRDKWAIPWLEDDPGLTAPELWVGRVRRDAADARRYGCDGLMGIHWRTRVLEPNVLALAWAAWDQHAWNPHPFGPTPKPPRTEGAVGGATAAFPYNPITGTEEGPIYQTVRYNLSAYNLALPNGQYAVTLEFSEPNYAAAGKRVFDVSLQGRRVITNLDIFAKVGQNRALNYHFDPIAVTNGWLDIGFTPVVEFPSIAGIVVQGAGVTRKINCGGPAWHDYAAEKIVPGTTEPYAPVADFYRDWANHEFGSTVGPAAAKIFDREDCHLPRPVDWINGPGGIRPNPRPWREVAPQYAFVREFAALQAKVRGAGNRERFDYWLETFRYLRAIARVDCAWAQFNTALAKAKAAPDAAARARLAEELALPAREHLIVRVRALFRHLFATISTTGELGTVMNWEQHNLPGLLTQPGKELAALLGKPLPPQAEPDTAYHGPTRLIVPTKRSSVTAGAPLHLRVLVLSAHPPISGRLWWRPLGRGQFTSVPLTHVARGVYTVQFPEQATAADFEYYVEVQDGRGQTVRFPATAPQLNQTVVTMTKD